MTADEIIARIGVDAFSNYAKRAWASAAQARHDPVPKNPDTAYADDDLVSATLDHICESGHLDEVGIDLVLEIYRKAPSYSWLAQLYIHISLNEISTSSCFQMKHGTTISFVACSTVRLTTSDGSRLRMRYRF